MKTTHMFYGVLMIATLFIISGCGDGSRVAQTLEENAAYLIELFPAPVKLPPDNKIHNNYRFLGKGNSVKIQLDEWVFHKGRKNTLHLCTLDLDQVDTAALEITKPEHRVGPISYKGGKVKVDPQKIIIRTKGEKPVIKCSVYNRGRGRMANNHDDRYREPGKGGTTESLSEIAIYAPTAQRAQTIVDALK